MPLSLRTAVAALLTALWAAPALAQASAASPASSASAADRSYRSALEGYRRFSGQPVAAWKASNDRVAQIGGWKAYAREAAGEEGAASASTTPASSPAQGGHQGHQHPQKP